MLYPLPSDTAAALQTPALQQQNLGLALDRFLATDEQWKFPVDVKKRTTAPIHLRDAVVGLISALQLRLEASYASLQTNGFTVRRFTAIPEYRMVLGFGAEHVLETSIYLHRIYGIPILPGSACKGLARAAAFWEIANALEIPALEIEKAGEPKKEKFEIPLYCLDKLLAATTEDTQKDIMQKLQANKECAGIPSIQSLTLSEWLKHSAVFTQIFGTQAQQGQVNFLDAFPTRKPNLEVDILNPHFGQYYKGQGPPVEWDKPNPNYFLTVGANSPFRFVVTSRESALAQQAETWLRCGLEKLGIGAKTASGYGFMKITN